MKSSGHKANHTLVLGWGNELRGDDGAGRAAARAVADRQWPQVLVEELHQLTPEWAAHFAHVQRVIFLDACRAGQFPDGPACLDAPWQSHVCVQPLQPMPRGETPHSVHRVSPAYLLALANELYGARPEAWWIGIPLMQAEWGTTFSPQTSAAIAAAVDACGDLITGTVSRDKEREMVQAERNSV